MSPRSPASIRYFLPESEVFCWGPTVVLDFRSQHSVAYPFLPRFLPYNIVSVWLFLPALTDLGQFFDGSCFQDAITEPPPIRQIAGYPPYSQLPVQRWLTLPLTNSASVYLFEEATISNTPRADHLWLPNMHFILCSSRDGSASIPA